MTHEESQLTRIVAHIIDLRRGQPRINPMLIATAAMREIDPLNRSPDLARLGCHLQLRQIARGLCRKLFEPDRPAVREPELFDGLQWRYPTMRSKGDTEPEYILRDLMSDDDIAYNVERLRSEAQAKLHHADALEAWGSARRAAK
jgi:hypothetical protein